MFSLILSSKLLSTSDICFGILASTFTIRFHIFQFFTTPKSLTLNLIQGFVFAGIFNFTFFLFVHSTSILQPKIKSKIGTS